MSLKPKRVEFDKIWPDVLKTIQGVITCGPVERQTWNERFSDVYKLCTALPEPQGDRLYTDTKAFLENHVKTLHAGTLGELIAELAAELQPFACHLAVAFWQYRQFRQLRDHLPPNQVLTLLDFAENYRCDFQHEVQAAHWSYNQATVLPTVNYYRCTCGELVTECVVFISSDLQHDASAVHACTAQLLHHLREKRHLKVDRQEIIRNAEEAFQYLKQNFAVDPDGDACCHSRRVFLRLEDINRKRPDRRPNNPVPGMRSIHCVRPEEPNTILHRRLSCYCAECMLGDPCHTMRTLPHGQWKSHVFRCPQAVPAAKPSDAKPSTASKPSDAKPSSATRPSDAKPSTAAKPSDATRPSDAKPSTAAKPSSATRPSDAKPSTAAKPSDAKPSSATRPSDAKPSTAAKPSDAKPSDAKPSTAAKPSDAKPSTAAKPSDAKPSSATRPSDAKPSTAAKPSDAKPSTAAKPSDAKPSSATRPSDAKPSTAAKPSDATPSSATRPSDAKPSTAAEPSDAKPSTTAEPSDAKPSSAATPSDSKPFSDAKLSSAAKPSTDAKPFAAMPCNAKRSTAPKRFAAKPSTAPKPSAAKCSTAPKPYHAKPSTAPKPFAAKPSDAKPSTAPKPSADPKCPPPLPMSFFRDMLKSLGKVKDWTTLEALAEQHHGLMQPVMMQQLDTSDFQIDEPSLALFPADVPSTSSLSPIAIYGDGNCLPRCGSVLAWGTQERHLEMRARIALELIINKSHYLSDPDSTFCAQYSEHFLNEKLTKAAIDNIFQLELRDIFKAGTYMGMWQVLALTSVLQHPILSIYPEYGGYTVRPHLHKLCTPRSQPTPAPHHSSTYLPGIMWTHIHGKCLPALTWRPNHFVVCLPSSDVGNCASVCVKPGDFVLVGIPTEKTVVEYVAQQVCASGHDVLSAYYRHWQNYSRGAGYLNQLYGYLNTTFIKKQKFSDADLNYGGFSVDNTDHMLEIGELALDIWRKHMIDPQKSTLTTLLLSDISADRQGHLVMESVVKGVVSSLVDVENYKKKQAMQLYEEMFENPFLRETGEYYRSEASRLKADCTCSEYMEKVLQRIDTENMRCTKFVHPTTIHKVNQECQQRMVADHLGFLHGETLEMVQKEKHKDLANMYKLLHPLHQGLSRLLECVEEHIRCTGLDAVNNLKQESLPSQFVEAVLEVHSHFSELIRKDFNNDQQFVGALDKACAAVINHKPAIKGPCKSPELLARYCDLLLKKSSKVVSESELDDRLARCITVFKYLDDKDIFQRFYARMLAKRLIYSLSQSMDAEEAMINKLKQACGYEFTNKLHRMFTDMSVSNDHNTGFQQHLQKQKIDLDISFSVMVLQAGAWPISGSQIFPFNIPQELEKTVRTFDSYYSGKFSGRKLTWLHNYCHGELKFNYLKRPYIVNVASYLMGILLTFNSSPTQSFTELASATGLPERELLRHLSSLCETKIIQAEDEVSESSVFTLNMNYSNKRTKFRINVAMSQRDTPQDVENTHSAVDDDRKMFVQAAIVRIMKARKVLKHNMLIQEVITQSTHRFHPNISMIKKCIETLIDKQYLERAPACPEEYSYVA